jgi:hypothetical protein
MFKALDDYFSNLQESKDSHQSAVEAAPETSPESLVSELEVSKATLTVHVEFTNETKCDCEQVKIEPEIEVKMEMPVKKTFSELFARFISIYFGCSNKRADVIIPSNKPVEIVKPASTTEKVVESDKDAAAI